MSSSEFKGLFGSVATSSKANNENAGFRGFLTPQIQKKMTLANSSNAYNENGFVSLTPRNKNMMQRKKLYSETNAKVVLGDRKNTAFNTMTPLKHGNVFVEKAKPDAAFQPKYHISNIPNDPFSTPTKGNFHPSQKTTNEIWNENLMLSEDQFNLLFMEPNVPSPPIPSPEPEWTNSYVESPPPVPWQNFSLGSPVESGNVSEDYELPSINLSFDDSY